MSTKDQLLYSALHGTTIRYAASAATWMKRVPRCVT